MSDTQHQPRLPVKRDDAPSLRERMSENAYEKILPARYLQRDDEGELVETQEELFARVAKNVAVAEAVHATPDPITIRPEHIKPDHPRHEELVDEIIAPDVGYAPLIEETAPYVSYDALIEDVEESVAEQMKTWAREFESAMSYLEFMPNSPTLMNAGGELQQLSACFVDNPADDIGDIHETAKEAAMIFQSGGGVGYSFSELRPYGDTVGSTGGIASGPITFMRTFDQMCATIAQGGTRRGAQMGVLRIDHPDVIQFLHAKNKDVSLAESLRLDDPDDPTHAEYGQALDEARELIDDEGRVPKHLRNAVEGHLSNFNISVAVTDRFMEALENGEEYDLINPRTDEVHIATEETKAEYDWFGLGSHVEVGEPLSLPASAIWDHLVSGAHENGEPGIIFIDQVNEMHSFDVEKHPEYEIKSTNPCGEQPLMNYEACNLGHINLSTLAHHDAVPFERFVDERGVEWDILTRRDRVELVHEYMFHNVDLEELSRRVDLGVRFLDNVVTMSMFPVDDITEQVSSFRKIGLGVMGLAQLYLQLGIRYGSEAGNILAGELMRYLNHESKTASYLLAEDRDSFDAWGDSKYANPTEYPRWFAYHVGEDASDWSDGFPIRNHNTTTIAPTGTTSMISNTSGGCEPLYNVAYYKNVTDDVQGDEMLVEFDDYFLRVLEANDIDVEAVKAEAAEQMAANEFDGVDGLSAVPNEIARLFVTTQDLSGSEHAAVQAACQRGVDSSISKTVNLPNSATEEDVSDVFRQLHADGGKSVTVYRDGTRTKQVLTTRADNAESAEESDEGDGSTEERNRTGAPTEPRERPDVTWGETHKINTGYGGLYVTINQDSNGPHEVFANIGKSGGFTQSMTEAQGRLISLCLRCGIPIETISDQLEGIRSPKPGWDNGETVESIPDAVALALQRYAGKRHRVEDVLEQAESQMEAESEAEDAKEAGGVAELIDAGESPECPECGSMVAYVEGCKRCESCGWGECG